MATLDENLQALQQTKDNFKTKFTNKGVSYSNVKFEDFPDLLDGMQKSKTGEVVVVTPTETQQVITPTQDHELTSVTVNAIQTETKTVTPTTSAQAIYPSTGKYIKQVNVNAVTSSIDANIQAGNIKKDVTILGVTGTLEQGSGGTDVSDTTATASDVLSGKDFYLANGTKTSGTIETYSGSTTVTENATLQTAGKYLSDNIVVNVAGGSTVITIDSMQDFPSTADDGTYVILMATPLRVWYRTNGVWVELPITVTETLNAQGGYTIEITTAQYTETLNAQGGYTMTIGGSN